MPQQCNTTVLVILLCLPLVIFSLECERTHVIHIHTATFLDFERALVALQQCPFALQVTINHGYLLQYNIGTNVAKMAPLLQNMNLLRVLDLSYQGIPDSGALALAAVIPKLVELRELRMTKNHLTVDGARALIKAVQRLPKIERVDVRYNLLSDAEMQELAKLDSKRVLVVQKRWK